MRDVRSGVVCRSFRSGVVFNAGFLGKRARCSTNSSAVHFRGLVNIYDRVFPLTQARLLGSAGVATHTSHCKALR